MTTLRRAALRLFGLDSAPVWILAALLVAATSPAWAASHGGGGGHSSGGGHSGGGGHSSAGASHGSSGHAFSGSRSTGFRSGGFRGPGSAARFGGRTAIPGRPGNFRQGGGFRDGGRFHGGFHDRGFFGGRFGFGLGLGLGFGYDPFLWGYYPYYPYWGAPYWANLYYPYSPSVYGWEDPGYPAYPPDGGGYGSPSPGDSGDYGPPPSRDSRDSGSRSSRDRRDQGAIDISISPRDTQVYLNGQYIGVAEDFDGWPQYLWLASGTYDIVFYHEGYKTLARQVTVYPGQKISYNDKLERGQAIRPEDLQSKSHERRDERMRYEADRNRQLSGGDSSDWQSRVRAHRGDDSSDRGGNDANRVEGQPVDAMPGTPPPSPPPHMSDAAGTRQGQARLHLTVEPDDASVYLDGRFIGSAAEINDRGDGLVVAAGKHHLAVVRPGRKAEERDLDVTPGNDLDVDVKLDRLHR